MNMWQSEKHVQYEVWSGSYDAVGLFVYQSLCKHHGQFEISGHFDKL